MSALNISPFQPLNSLGAGIRPLSNSPTGMRPLSSKPKSAFDQMDVGQIGKGSRLREGSYEKKFGRPVGYGLKGQLGVLQWEGRRGVTKNLSDKNVEQIHDIIAGRLKKKNFYGTGSFNRKDVMAITKESRQLVKTKGSDFTMEDRKDLLKVVGVMREKYKDRVLGRGESADMPSAGHMAPPVAGKDVLGADHFGRPDLGHLSNGPENGEQGTLAE